MKPVWRLMVLAMFLLSVLAGCSGGGGGSNPPPGGNITTVTETEPNNDGDNAQVIASEQAINGNTSGSVEPYNSPDLDFFAITPATSGLYTIKLSNYGTANLNLCLFLGTKSNDSYPILAMSGLVNDSNPTETIIYAMTAGQRYIIGVQPWLTSGNTPYTLTVTTGGENTFPTITGFAPASGVPGTQVTITGSNFGSDPAVGFNFTEAVVATSSDTSIVVAVPTGATTGQIMVINGTSSVYSTTEFTVSPAAAWPVINAPASINTPTTWLAGNVYLVNGTTNVTSVLTIQPGTVVKFNAGADINVNSNGTLIADGQPDDNRIVFTSIKDDSFGGDSNADGSATTPQRGDWDGVDVGANGSLFNHCLFSYGGQTSTNATLSIWNNATVQITNCIFAHNRGGTLTDLRGATLNVSSAAVGTTITGNIFYDNDMPLVINGKVDIDDSNVFHSGDVKNTYNGIFYYDQSGGVTGSRTWSNTEVAYVVTGSQLWLENGETLNLANNVIVKFSTTTVTLGSGSALNMGDGVYLTSIKDDTKLGDANGDGATSPATGDWYGVDDCLGSGCQWANWANILYATKP